MSRASNRGVLAAAIRKKVTDVIVIGTAHQRPYLASSGPVKLDVGELCILEAQLLYALAQVRVKVQDAGGKLLGRLPRASLFVNKIAPKPKR